MSEAAMTEMDAKSVELMDELVAAARDFLKVYDEFEPGRDASKAGPATGRLINGAVAYAVRTEQVMRERRERGE